MLLHTPLSATRPVAHAAASIWTGLFLLVAPCGAWAAQPATPAAQHPVTHPATQQTPAASTSISLSTPTPTSTSTSTAAAPTAAASAPSALPYGSGYERRQLAQKTQPAQAPRVPTDTPPASGVTPGSGGSGRGAGAGVGVGVGVGTGSGSGNANGAGSSGGQGKGRAR